MDAEGGGESRGGLRLPPDRHRPGAGRTRGDGRARGGRGHHLQAVHGVPRPPDGGRRNHLPRVATHRGERRHGADARGERRRDRGAGPAGPRGGADGAEVPRPDAPAPHRGGGDAPGDRPGRDRGGADLHRPRLVRRGGGRGGGRASARRERAGGDLSPVPLPVRRALRRAGLRGRQVRDEPALEAARRPGAAVARARGRRAAGGGHRPLPVQHEGPEESRPGRFHADTGRRAGHRDADEPGVRRRSAGGAHLAQPVRRAHGHQSRQDLRPLSPERRDRARLRRRRRRLGSGAGVHLERGDPPHAGGLQSVRGPRGERARRRWCGRGAGG